MSELIIEYDLSVQPATDRDTRIRDTAPEMLKLIQALSTATESGFGSEVSMKTLYWRLVCLRDEAKQLLARIDGGGDE